MDEDAKKVALRIISYGLYVLTAEVVDASVRRIPEERPDAATLTLPDLGEKIFYGG